eukprot:UN15917
MNFLALKTFPKTTEFDSYRYRFVVDSKIKHVKKGNLTLERRRMSCNTYTGRHKGEFELCQHAELVACQTLPKSYND